MLDFVLDVEHNNNLVFVTTVILLLANRTCANRCAADQPTRERDGPPADLTFSPQPQTLLTPSVYTHRSKNGVARVVVVLPDNNNNENNSYAFVTPVALAVAKAVSSITNALLCRPWTAKTTKNFKRQPKTNKHCVDAVFCNSCGRDNIVGDLVDFALIKICVAKIP